MKEWIIGMVEWWKDGKNRRRKIGRLESRRLG
jgi:hypothetical protein